MNRIAPLLALALLFAVAAPASAHYAPKGQKCKRVVFTPQSDDVADSIRARGVTCRRARRIVRMIRYNRDKTPFDFRCRGRGHDPTNGLAHSDILCTKGERRVTWAQY